MLIEKRTGFFFLPLSEQSICHKINGIYFHFWRSRKNINQGFVRVKVFLWFFFIFFYTSQLIWRRFINSSIQVKTGRWKPHRAAITTSKMCQTVFRRAFTIFSFSFFLNTSFFLEKTFTDKWISSWRLPQTAVIISKRHQHDLYKLCFTQILITAWLVSTFLTRTWPLM